MPVTKAVLFDLFETLISEYAGGVRKASRSNKGNAERLGLSHDVYRREWGAAHEKRMTGQFADYFAVMRHLLKGQQVKVDDRVVKELYEERVLEKKAAFQGIDPEVIELLRRLKQEGVKLGLVSNCTEEEVHAWPDCGLAPYFDEVLFSYQAGFAKPDRSIYNLACDRLGVKAEECVFIGDGGSDELNGATRAGMKAYHAVWYLPLEMRDKITGHPKLERPLQAMEEIRRS
ncbi:HAD family hydrolase [Paenibacillus mesophilus]|uniref:HAD family hydrolase n=1 Tax=Paenibacillus mesophilus TaxID=2582849 RepID=UPI001305183F|nr:HAD-IA family hydrolase [Paenibacillus mesophilus]